MKSKFETCSANEENDLGWPNMKGRTIHPRCPNEVELLAFYERDIPSWKRALIEKHLGECEWCRQSIAMVVSLGRAADQQSDEERDSIGEDLIRTQVARVVSFAGDDEVRRGGGAAAEPAGSLSASRPGTMFGVPLSRGVMLTLAAVVLILLAVPVLFWITTRPSPSAEAMQALIQAVAMERRSPAMVSGLPYSQYNGLRGTSDRGDDLMFDRAENKVKGQASPKDKLALARVWIARNTGNDPQKALNILSQLVASGTASAQVWNDKGVAEFELRNYEAATESFTAALQLSPGLPEALFNRGLSEQAKGRQHEARLDLEKFIGTNPDPNWRKEAEAMLARLGGPSTVPR